MLSCFVTRTGGGQRPQVDRGPRESPEGETSAGGVHQKEGLGRQHRQAVSDNVSRRIQVVS